MSFYAKRMLLAAGMSVGIMATVSAMASIVELRTSIHTQVPTDSNRYLSVEISQGSDPRTVHLSVTPHLATSSEFISTFYFNSPDQPLSYSVGQGDQVFLKSNPAYQQDGFNAPGAAWFDFGVSFNTSAKRERLNSGETFDMTITYPRSIALGDMLTALSSPKGKGSGGKWSDAVPSSSFGGYPFAAHVQGISGGLSTVIVFDDNPQESPIAVSEASTLIAGVVALGALAAAFMRQRAKLDARLS